MPGLPELQADFCANIFDRSNSDHIVDSIRANGLPPERRVQVYRNNVYTSLTEALRAVHPVVHKLVGDGFFGYTASEFITRYPSTSGDLHDFGNKFHEFLAEFAPAQSLPYLPDVALLEWYYHEAYHAAEHDPLELSRLAKVPPDRFVDLKLQLHPAARLLRSEFPVLKIWQVNQDDHTGDQSVDLDEGGDYLLIMRPAFEIEFHRLDRGDYMLLEALARGDVLSAAVDSVLTVEPAFELQKALTRFAQTQTLVGFSVSG